MMSNLYSLIAANVLSLPLFAADAADVPKAVPAKPAAVVELFEDDADQLLKLLTNPGDGPGNGEAETKEVFSGKQSLKITQYQRFHRKLPGWNHAIRAKPAPGEYRFLRFAWKTGGSDSLMLQLHDVLDWNIRYTAGPNPHGWATRFLADKAPDAWTLMTIDLFKDFGERNLTGIAFTINGGAGYFDHVYLGRTIDDLDRIDASGLAGKQLRLEAPQLERLWLELIADDAAKKYRAYWTLVAGGPDSEAFLRAKLTPPKTSGPESKQILDWIAKLDADNFAVREKAMAELKKRLQAAVPLLEDALAGSPSEEMRRRLESMLSSRPGDDANRLRRAQALRVLEAIAARKSSR